MKKIKENGLYRSKANIRIRVIVFDDDPSKDDKKNGACGIALLEDSNNSPVFPINRAGKCLTKFYAEQKDEFDIK